jgi:UDP-N-acetyl-D-mannosaminuronic acid dehydrogenase
VLDAQVIVIATNHSDFERPGTLQAIADSAASDCLIVDPWNCLGAAQVFAYAPEVAALTAAQ